VTKPKKEAETHTETPLDAIAPFSPELGKNNIWTFCLRFQSVPEWAIPVSHDPYLGFKLFFMRTYYAKAHTNFLLWK
jgi:hypothetical protein